MIGSLVRTIDRQGLLKGDLNFVQRAALQWLMTTEITETFELEKFRIEHNALASNSATSPEYLKTIFERKEESKSQPEEEEWVSFDNADELNRFFSGLQG